MLLIGGFSYWFVKPKDKGFYLGLAGFGLLGMLVYWLALEHFGLYQIGKVQWFKVTVWIAAFSSIAIAGIAGQLVTGINSGYALRKSLLPVSLLGSILLLCSITNSKYLPESIHGKWMVGNRTYSDLEKMHQWIEANTDKDISVLVAPTNNAFGCQARRSTPHAYEGCRHRRGRL